MPYPPGVLAGTLGGVPSIEDDQTPLVGPVAGNDFLRGGFNPNLQNQFLSGNLQEIQDLFATQRAQNEEQGRKGIGLNLKPDGTATVTGDIQDIMRGLQGATAYQKLVEGYSNQLQARIDQTRAHPLASGLAQLAANIGANDPHLPGWVRGAAITAQQLNPTVSQLQQQQIGLAAQLAQLQSKQFETGIQYANAVTSRLSEQNRAEAETRHAQEGPIHDLLKVQGEHLTAAARGELDPATATASAVQAGLVKPENAPAYQAQLQGAVDRFASVKNEAQKKQFAQDVLKAQLGAESQARVFTQQNALLDKRLAAQDAMLEKRLSAQEDRTTAKLSKPPATVEGQLKELNAADNALAEVEKLLKDPELTKNMGPIIGRIVSANPYRSAQDQATITQLKLQTANAIKSTGAGARGFGPQERPFFERLSEGIQNTPEQNQAILDKWRAYLDQERKAIVSSYRDVDWDKYAPALGPRLAPQVPAPVVPQGWKIEVVK
jgi:hypothetical protein